jgi:hypothetical protein
MVRPVLLMATSPVDMKSMMAQQMVKRLATHGQEGSDPSAAGRQLSEQMSQLSGADPKMLSKAMEQVKSMLVAIYTKTAFQVPEAARHAAQAQKSVDAAIKALEQASATEQTVAPIVNQAGMSNQEAQGPQPQQGGIQ